MAVSQLSLTSNTTWETSKLIEIEKKRKILERFS